MSGFPNHGPKGPFRVLQRDTLIDECDRPEEAFSKAAAHNRSIGIGNILRSPYLVFSGDGHLLFGPAELCPDLI